MANYGKRPHSWLRNLAAAGLTGSVISAPVMAQEAAAPAAGDRPAHYAMSPESSTLPEKVVRARIPFVSATSKGAAYDIDGKKVDGGLSANVLASGLAVEYGFSDNLSVGVFAPFVIRNNLGMNADNFKNQRGYQLSKRNFYVAASNLMIGLGVCSDQAQCWALIDSGYAFPYDLNVQLTSGEPASLKAGVPLNQAVHSLLANAAKPEAGTTGLGDMDIGVKYRWLKGDTMGHAVALVLHAPTGKYEDVTLSQRATGRGIMELGLRSHFDYKFSDNYIAGWQHTIDYAVGKGKIKRSKLLDNTQMDDVQDEAAAGSFADGYANSNTFKRPGVRNVGFFDVKTSFGQFTPALAPVGGKLRYGYDFDTSVQVEEREDAASNGFRGATERSQLHTLGLGLVFDGFQMENRIPVRLTWDLDMPVKGANKAVAPLRNTVITELYYKF
ncbi:MAG: hypothetical protein RIQ81_1280 [Pseudomonadota bacterium]|jgi:hypothetical protein